MDMREIAALDPNSPDYAVQFQELARRRKLADALGAAPMPQAGMVSGHYVAPGWAGALGQVAQALINKRNQNSLDQQERGLSAAQQTAAQQWFNTMPQGTPANPGSPSPPDELGGGPPLAPTPATPPTPAQMTAWAGRGMGISPATAATAGVVMKDVAAASAPMTRYQTAQTEIAGREADSKERERVDRLVERERAARAIIEDKAASREAKIEAQKAYEQLQRDLAKEKNETRLEVARLVAALHGDRVQFTQAGTAEDGSPIMLSRSGTFHKSVNGVPESTPYAGKVYKPGDEKNVGAAMGAEAEAQYNERLAKEVDAADPKVFGPRVGVGNSVSSRMGGAFKEQLTGLTPEQLALRGKIGRDFAETTKRLYGANFTAAEMERANTFIPQQGESQALTATKLRGAAEFARQMARKYGPKAQDAAQTRMAPTPGGATDGWGRAEATP